MTTRQQNKFSLIETREIKGIYFEEKITLISHRKMYLFKCKYMK